MSETTHEVIHPDIVVSYNMSGEHNAYKILNDVRQLIQNQHGTAAAKTYQLEATSGDYDNLIRITARWVNFTDISGTFSSSGERLIPYEATYEPDEDFYDDILDYDDEDLDDSDAYDDYLDYMGYDNYLHDDDGIS